MKQKRYTVDQIIPKLRSADVELGKGLKVPEVCKNCADLLSLASEVRRHGSRDG